MKKLLLLSGFLVVLLSACTRYNSDITSQSAIDDARIRAYIEANHINATKGPYGIYYEILKTDTSTQHPTSTSSVQVSYVGTLLNGANIQPQATSILDLNGADEAIGGFQVAMPLMTIGERMLLIVPSTLGYGSVTQGNVPANSVLVFTIDLLGFY